MNFRQLESVVEPTQREITNASMVGIFGVIAYMWLMGWTGHKEVWYYDLLGIFGMLAYGSLYLVIFRRLRKHLRLTIGEYLMSALALPPVIFSLAWGRKRSDSAAGLSNNTPNEAKPT